MMQQKMIEFRRSPLGAKYKRMVRHLYLHIGQAFRCQELTEMLDAHESDIRLCVRHARRCGHPIMSGNAGYWMEKDPARLMDCANSLRGRALDILETVGQMNRAATRRQHWSLWSRWRSK